MVKSLSRICVLWADIDKALETLVKSWQGCKKKNRHMPTEAPIHPCEWPQRARQRIHVNFAGRLQGRMFMVVHFQNGPKKYKCRQPQQRKQWMYPEEYFLKMACRSFISNFNF